MKMLTRSTMVAGVTGETMSGISTIYLETRLGPRSYEDYTAAKASQFCSRVVMKILKNSTVKL